MNEFIDPINMTATLHGTKEVVPIKVGMPATEKIGGDSYPKIVEEVHTYKTGAKAGQLKGITANGTYYRLNKFNYLVGGYCWLALGYAHHRLDPHF